VPATKKPDGNSVLADTGKEASKVDGDGFPIWQNGIHRLPDPTKLKALPLRAAYRVGVYDRWCKYCSYQFIMLIPLSAVARGWKDKKMPWERVTDKPQNFLQPKFIENGFRLGKPERTDVASIRKIVHFFVQHQEGRITDEEGLMFMECGSGSSLHYPTIRPSTHSPFAV
jgi:hypothetical protein